MKIIKSVFFILILIIAAALITALFIEEDYAVEKEIVINMPRKHQISKKSRCIQRLVRHGS